MYDKESKMATVICIGTLIIVSDNHISTSSSSINGTLVIKENLDENLEPWFLKIKMNY